MRTIARRTQEQNDESPTATITSSSEDTKSSKSDWQQSILSQPSVATAVLLLVLLEHYLIYYVFLWSKMWKQARRIVTDDQPGYVLLSQEFTWGESPAWTVLYLLFERYTIIK